MKLNSSFKVNLAISQRWFDLDFDWIEINVSTCEPDFYKIFFKAMKIHKIKTHLNYFKFQ